MPPLKPGKVADLDAFNTQAGATSLWHAVRGNRKEAAALLIDGGADVDAADGEGATLLEGTGRTAQIGDTGAFFAGAGIMLAWGAIRNQPNILLAGGLLVGLVVPGRVASAIYHGGAWTPDEIVAECAITALALTTATLIQKRNRDAIFH